MKMYKKKDVEESIKRVHGAAMQQRFDLFSEFVVDVAKDLVGAENGRLRFVDYTEKRLVPGAIRGSLAEKPEMAIRTFKNGGHECIVGRAAAKKKIQLVRFVKNDPDFGTFRTEVKRRSQEDKRWKAYLDKTLEKLGSEIAAPVLAGQTLLGVLSVNTQRESAFDEEDAGAFSAFASEIAVAFLNRRAIMLDELHAIEEEMISEFELRQVAQHIADGIRRVTETGIPNIFLYSEEFTAQEGRPFRFLASAGASKEEKELGAFQPRSGPRGRGMEAIRRWKRKEDALVVVEDVDRSSSLGSPTARERGVKTTGCLPLVFKGTIMGVLYLHFKNKHFFTFEEKKILWTFATTAAIAMKNATMLPTYNEISGNGVIDQLDKFKPRELQ